MSQLRVNFYTIFLTLFILIGSKVNINAHSLGESTNIARDIEDDTWMHKGGNVGDGSIIEKRNVFPHQVEDQSFWIKSAQTMLLSKLKHKPIETEAKNTIMFLGDGLSLTTVTAARIFKGQLDNQSGEEGSLYFESFPNLALSKTFCSDSQVADSACSATAYLGGSKGNIKTIGVTVKVLQGDCVAQQNPANHVSSIVSWAQAAGKSTGIITNTRITHASPAGTYAHTSDRDYEYDGKVVDDGNDPETCHDIARQLILSSPGDKINVILGGGRSAFLPTTVNDPETEKPGYRTDNRNLIQIWEEKMANKSGKYITSAKALKEIDTKNTDYLLGLFSSDHLAYKENYAETDDPSLTEMVEVAIKILSKNPKGYFLFVEGGRIDHAHHENEAQRALIETIEFDEAIKTADSRTNDEDTLIVVTADHSHVMTINGYAQRGSDILNVAHHDSFDKPYATLSYANGPGYRQPVYSSTDGCGRGDISNDPFDDLNYKQEAMVKLSSETHGGDDVGIFAKGPWAHLYSGIQEQSYIPHVMAYASCIGNGIKYCDDKKDKTDNSFGVSILLGSSQISLILSLVVFYFLG